MKSSKNAPKPRKFQVTFACAHESVVSFQVEAADEAEATLKAETALQSGEIIFPDEATTACNSVLVGSNLKRSHLIKTRPCPENPFDLTGLSIAKHFGALRNEILCSESKEKKKTTNH